MELRYTGSLDGALRARATEVGPWEKFQCVAVSTNQWAIRSRANGKYVSVELGYSGALRDCSGTNTAVGAWEKFTINTGGSNFALKSSANNDYASAELGYGGTTHAILRGRATTIRPWETYAIAAD